LDTIVPTKKKRVRNKDKEKDNIEGGEQGDV